MSWFIKSQVSNPMEIIEQVLRNEIGVEEGGLAWNAMQMIGADACDAINTTAGRLGLSGIDASAYPKMMALAKAAGCSWSPEIPKQQQNVQQPAPMPVMEQEKPMDTPSVEIN